MVTELFKSKTIEEILEEFEAMCKTKSVTELQLILDKLLSITSIKDDAKRVEIVQRILTEKGA